MKYYSVSKFDGEREEISKERALQVLAKDYFRPEEALSSAEVYGKINTTFSVIEVEKL